MNSVNRIGILTIPLKTGFFVTIRLNLSGTEIIQCQARIKLTIFMEQYGAPLVALANGVHYAA
ncbi:MAG: hypothetical protein ACYC3H_09565 [Bellilinea sp.]